MSRRYVVLTGREASMVLSNTFMPESFLSPSKASALRRVYNARPDISWLSDADDEWAACILVRERKAGR